MNHTLLAHALRFVYRRLLTDATVFDTTQVCRLKPDSRSLLKHSIVASFREQRLCPAGINSTSRNRKKGILRWCGMTEVVKE
ncbi:MAG: hypothetical protein E8D41_03330 [Nitrospira sp.]|nr:MAG: hypothetical protein E8D41_03330 [Nitrospira sp.]